MQFGPPWKGFPLIVCVFVFLCGSKSIYAQRGSGGASTTGTTGSSTPSGSISGPTTRTPSSMGDDRTFSLPRPIFISGKVLFDDGSRPNTSIMIQRVCGGNAHTETHTDSKGRFQFQAGQNMDSLSDASVGLDSDTPGGLRRQQNARGRTADGSQRLTTRDLRGCEVRAAYPGYRSDSVNLFMHSALDNPDIGVIILHRLANVVGSTISMTTELAPKKAQKNYEKGMELAGKGKLAEAEQKMQAAVDEYPKYAVAWFELGRLQLGRKDKAAARKSYEMALAADQKYVSPYDGLALIALDDKNWQEAADRSAQTVALNPVEFPTSWMYNAYANYHLHKEDVALKSGLQATRLDTDHKLASVEELIAQIYINKQQYGDAAIHLKQYLLLRPDAPDAEVLKTQLLKLEQATSQAH